MIETGTLLQNRYLIEKKIGAGGMGAVYRAVDQRFGSPVAIKETFYKEDELGDAFEREARLLNSLLHPVLPHVSDYFTEGGGHFIVMQFIEGEDLSDILKREGAFAVPDVLRWTDSLLDALDYLHSQEPPIIHRDIKPQNLKLTPRRDIVLLDFGLAKLNSDDAQGALSVFGYSRKYAPLEQIQGTGTDARSDIFALGATAYHLFTGKPPLDALTRAAAIVAGNPDPLEPADEINDEIPANVAQILHSALKLNADQRFVSAKAMRKALELAVVVKASENVEQSPEQSSTIAAWDDGIAKSDTGIITLAETVNFPALEAFAAEAANNDLPETHFNDKTAAIKIPAANVESRLPAPENLTRATMAGDIMTRLSPRQKQSRVPLAAAAAAALLFCTILAAGYFINKANSSSKTSRVPVAQSSPELNTNAEQTAVASDLPAIKVSAAPLKENTAPVKAKARLSEKNAEKKEIVEETIDEEVVDNPKPVVMEKSRPPAQPRNTRRTQPENIGETRSREVDEAPVSDIESVFTGQPSEQEKPERKVGRRPPGDQTSDEELRDMRRQKREKRRERLDKNLPPF